MSNEQDLLKEFSPEFVATGLSGMLKSGEYEAVDVKFTFYRKAPPRETPPKKAESVPQADNRISDEIAFLEKLQKRYFDMRCIDYKNLGFIMLTERIKQLRA